MLTERYGYRPARDTGIDHIFARGTILDAGFDSERKAAVGTDAEFQACKTLYTEGRGPEATGTCATEFYADHSFVWGARRQRSRRHEDHDGSVANRPRARLSVDRRRSRRARRDVAQLLRIFTARFLVGGVLRRVHLDSPEDHHG